MIRRFLSQMSQRKKIASDFRKTVESYKDFLLAYFDSCSIDREYGMFLEKRIIDLFKASSMEMQMDLFRVAASIGHPIKHYKDANNNQQLRAWLQGQAFKMLDELEKEWS